MTILSIKIMAFKRFSVEIKGLFKQLEDFERKKCEWRALGTVGGMTSSRVKFNPSEASLK